MDTVGWTILRKSGEKGSENINRLVEKLGIAYDPLKEPDLSFDTRWVQDAENQRAIFKTFYEHVEVNKSLEIPMPLRKQKQ